MAEVERSKFIASMLAALVLSSILICSVPSVRAEDSMPTVLAKLDLNDQDTFVFEGQIIGFNDDGSFYYLSYHQYIFGGGALVKFSLISADLKVQWSKSFYGVMTWAVAPDGGLAVLGANSSYGGIHVHTYDRSGGERWSAQCPPTDLTESRMAVTADGTVVVGERDLMIENSTTARVFDPTGNILDLTLPDELRNTTLPFILKNGTLTAQRQDRLFGLSSDLEIQWELALPLPIPLGDPNHWIGDENITVMMNELEFIDGRMMNSGGIFRYDLNGELLWRFPSVFDERYYAGLTVRDRDGMSFFIRDPYNRFNANLTLFALFPNGTLAWTYDLGTDYYQWISIYEDGVVLWNRTAFSAVDGEGNRSWIIVPGNLVQRWSNAYLYVDHDRIYVTDSNNITAYGKFTEPEKPQDWSLFLLAPLFIAVVLVMVYLKGKGMRENE